MSQLSTVRSKRQFYRVLHNEAEKAVCNIEGIEGMSKKRKVTDHSMHIDLDNRINFNASFKHYVQRNNIDDNKNQRDIADKNEYQIYENMSSRESSVNSSSNTNDKEYVNNSSDILSIYQDNEIMFPEPHSKIKNTEMSQNNDFNAYLQTNLKTWAIENNITRISFQRLLKILKVFCPNLPTDPRSIFQQSNDIQVEIMGNGQYYNFGLQFMLEKQLEIRKPLSQQIWLQFNVDGLPLFKSSRIQFWPILCLIKEIGFQPFVCAIYCGKEKPELKLFLKDFVAELKDLIFSGITVNNVRYEIFVKCFTCDAPARAFLKGIKGHGGYYGCEKCVQKGKWQKGRLTFPNHFSSLRTDESFAQMKQKKHHKEKSPLVDIGIKMISMFPLDPMHLVYLGVMRKLLHIWTSGKSRTRISCKDINTINERLNRAAHLWPQDFNRKPRGLGELHMWKATEFKQFLLYLGPIVLASRLPTDIYKHFLLLHVSMFILSRENISQTDLVQAEHTLRQFVVNSTYKNLYGKTFLIYNVHSLLHLVDDVKYHGSLSEFSAFPFENKLSSVKRMIRGKNKPLQQLINRTLEMTEVNSIDGDAFVMKNGPVITSTHSAGPCLSLTGTQYSKIQWNNSILSLKDGDNAVITSQNEVVKVINFVDTENGIFLIGKRFKKYRDLYNMPCKSSNLHINVVENLSEQPPKWHLNDILYKAILVPYKKKNVSFPLQK